MLFVGSFPHHPNRDAAHWLVEEDHAAAVRRANPEIATYIVAARRRGHLGPRERKRPDPRLGAGSDELLETRACRWDRLARGAGAKGKAGESMAHGPACSGRPGSSRGNGPSSTSTTFLPPMAPRDRERDPSRRLTTRICGPGWQKNGRRTIARESSPYAIRLSLAKILEEIGVKVKRPDASRSSAA